MIVKQIETPKHAVDVEELAQQHHAEFGKARQFAKSAVGEACWNCVLDKRRTQVNCWVAYDDHDHPVGYIAGTIHRSFYSYSKYAVQEMWYVVPGARRSSTATKLLRAYEQWAVEHKCERIYTQVEHDDEPELVERILRLMQYFGYNKQGYIAVKRPVYTHEEHDNDRSTHRGVGAEQEPAQV